MNLPTFRESDASDMIDEKVIRLLERMLDEEEFDRLEPEYEPNAKYGFAYPEANEVLERDHGEEVEVLELLHNLGYLQADFFDKAFLCPYCNSHHIHLRRACPECSSTNIRKVSLLHCFSSGHVDLEENFMQQGELVDPKSGETLKHIGVDYERVGKAWHCEECGYISQHPVENYHCHNCNRISEKDQVIEKEIHNFEASPEASVAIEDGKLYDFKYFQVVSDGVTQLVNMSYFREQGKKEIARSVRYGNEITFLLMRVENLDEMIDHYGKTQVDQMFRDVAQITKNTLRECDLVARYDENSLLVQLPETGPMNSIIAINRVSYNLTRSDVWREYEDLRPEIRVSTANTPEDAHDYEELIETLEDRIEDTSLLLGTIQDVAD